MGPRAALRLRGGRRHGAAAPICMTESDLPPQSILAVLSAARGPSARGAHRAGESVPL